MDASILILFKKSRTTLLRQLDGVPENAARQVPQGLNNHILWYAGHSFVLVERCVFIATDGWQEIPPAIPEGWWDMFGWSSKPGEIADELWPPLDAVRVELEKQYARLGETLATFDEVFLASTMPDNNEARWKDKPKREVIVHGFYDEIYHAGQVALTKKLL